MVDKLRIVGLSLLLAVVALGGSLALRPVFATGQSERASDARPRRASTDAEKIQGAWTSIAVNVDGTALPGVAARDLITLVFRGDTVQFETRAGLPKLMLALYESKTPAAKFKLDTLASPKRMDLITRGKVEHAIYSLEDDSLQLCLGDKQRPTQFGSKPGSGDTFLILKRKSAPKGDNNVSVSTEDASARHAEPALDRQGKVPLGLFGYPLGTYLTIAGKRADGFKTGTQTLSVDTLSGKKLKHPIPIWVDNVRTLPESTRVILKGYETGRMIGVPPAEEAAAREQGQDRPMPQAGWQFRITFVATSAVAPKSLAIERKQRVLPTDRETRPGQ